MQIIESPDNRIVKQAASLAEKKYRDALGLYLIEGPNFIRDALTWGGRLRFIFTRAGASSQELEDIKALCENGPAVITLTSNAFARICGTENSQGIAAVAEKRSFSEEEFFKDPGSCILVADRVQDPGNLGTMMRTAEAMGFAGMIAVKGCADVYGPKTVRAAAGSLFRLPVIFAESAEETLALLNKHEKKVYSAVMEGGIASFDADLKSSAAVVVGNEGNGVSSEFLKASEKLSIPMRGKIESLNAALAAGMLMYESYRQRSTAD